MTQEELKIVLEKHKKWLNCENGGVRADFHGADLHGADFHGADLHGADLFGANLREANLSYVNLHGAYLFSANLYGADLRGANLGNAALRDANLYGANLMGAENIPFLPQLIVCPPEGSFTAYKKLANKFIAKLLIPEDAKRSNATSRKCRCDKALVVAIYDTNGNEVKSGTSSFDSTFDYEVGKVVSVADFDEDRWVECSTGIHFFMSKQEAIDY